MEAMLRGTSRGCQKPTLGSKLLLLSQSCLNFQGTKAQGLQDIALSRPWAKDAPTEESQDLILRWRQW